MIELRGLTKHYGDTVAVDDVTVDIAPGRVTGFLGPNGAGKTTTMRLLLGLDHPTSGTATFDGRPYRDLQAPLHEVGAVLDTATVHPGRRARAHLVAMARSHAIPEARVDEMLARVGLTEVAGQRVGGFSLGMRQRLGVATALLGDPAVLLLDEPVNGLDPEGVRWIRRLVRRLADDGRTVLLSSHLMSEMQLTADHLIVIGAGRVLADEPLEGFVAGRSLATVVVVTEDAGRLADALERSGLRPSRVDARRLEVEGGSAREVGRVALEAEVVLEELTTRRSSLEDVFMEVTGDTRQFEATAEDGS